MMRIHTKQLVVGLILCVLFVAPRAFAAEDHVASAKSPSAKSLDDELLKSLIDPPTKADEKATEAPTAKPAKLPTEPSAIQHKSDNPLDEALRKSLGDDPGSDGEDIGESQFTKVAREMRSVQERLAQSNSDAATQTQQKQIAAELAALVEQLRKQQCSGSKSGSKSSKGGSAAKPGGGKSGSGNSPVGDPSNHPARESTADVRPNRSDRPDPVAIRELLTKSPDWLKLPEKERDQMLQGAADEFLPNYEFAIKKYFERIIEEEERAERR
jgi:hypothetical protein